MAYAPHTLITCSGSLSEKTPNDEIWQIGVRGSNSDGGGPIDPDDLDAVLDDISAALVTWFQAAGSGMSGNATMTRLKAVNIGPDGHYTSDASVKAVSAVGAVGATPSAPSYCSIAYSWKTPLLGRRATHGRVYPPNYGYGVVAATATISSANQTAALTAAGQFLHALSSGPTGRKFIPSIFSEYGISAPIDGIRVGNVWDVQRRRKNAVPETYAAATFVP